MSVLNDSRCLSGSNIRNICKLNFCLSMFPYSLATSLYQLFHLYRELKTSITLTNMICTCN